MVISSLTGEQETLLRLEANRLSTQVVSRHTGALDPLARPRHALLRERGLLPGDAEDVEDLAVIAATRN